MFGNDPDKDWEKFGRQQPYFGVINSDEFLKEKMGEDGLRKFFGTGSDYIDWVFGRIAQHLDAGFKPEEGLDFGCGVGRLLIPLASRCKRVVGVDVSPSMLEETRKNFGRMGISNAELAQTVSAIDPGRRFDFINSYIVFQHIIPEKGLAIFRELIARLKPGGIAAIHMTYHSEIRLRSALVGALRKKSNLANMFFNVLKGLPPSSPWMQMNDYDLDVLAREIDKGGCEGFHALFNNNAGFNGVILFFRKRSQPAGT
jgi:SAM-dependent methyltransferase